MTLNKKTMKEYQARWQIISQAEALEKQNRSLTQRWVDLNRLYQMAAALELQPRQAHLPQHSVDNQLLQLKLLYLEQERKQA